jgi:hypothetical protein
LKISGFTVGEFAIGLEPAIFIAVSTKLSQAPHCMHLPLHLLDVEPQDWHMN